jgi:hypothetical protein
MNQTAERLRETVRKASDRLSMISDEAARRRPAPGKWSPIEIIGHLVDSASINHQRLVRGLFRDDFVFEGYDADEWVDSQHYREAPWPALVTLWREFNLHLARVVDATPESELARPRMPHTLHRIAWQKAPEDEPVTITWWFADYLGHLEHHLRQIPADLVRAT